MINCYKIISNFDKSIIYIYKNNNNNNFRFQYELSINYESESDDFDYGQYWISSENPINTENGINIYNSYSLGFLNFTGKNLLKNGYSGMSAGSITFIAANQLNSMTFRKSQINSNTYNIRAFKNDILTESYLTYDIDNGEVFFLNIDDMYKLPHSLNCDWIIEKLERNAPVK